MMYVDLNPIRAGFHNTLEDSAFTSIQERLVEFSHRYKETKKQKTKSRAFNQATSPATALLNFKGNESLAKNECTGVPFSLVDYFELIDWSGRAVRSDKRGANPPNISPILHKLGVNEKEWANNVNHFGRRFYHAVGAVDTMRKYSDKLGRWWMQGVGRVNMLYAKA